MIELAKRIERVALDRDERVTGVEEVVYVDEDGDAAIATSRGVSRALRGVDRLRVPAGDGERGLRGADRARLRGGPLAARPRRRRQIGAEAGDEASSMLGATKPESRTCPVVLSDRVAASFAGFIGGALCADVVQRGRSPFADRLGDELASEALRAGRRRHRSRRARQRAVRRRGDAPRAHRRCSADGKLLAYLHDSYTARRGGAESTGNAGARLATARRPR